MYPLRYRDALSAAVETRRAEVVMSVLEELSARDGLDQALGGRDAVSLTALLRFVARHIAEPRYCKLMCSLTHRLLDLYASVVGVSTQVRYIHPTHTTDKDPGPWLILSY